MSEADSPGGLLSESHSAGGRREELKVEKFDDVWKSLNFTEEFEKIIENHMAKKYKMKYEIEHKFLPQIEELVETNASAIVLRVVQNVKR